MKIKRQTVGAPLLETFLYISVFGAALGSRIDKLHGIDYVVFVVPGLIMMAWAMNAFSNNASSILQQKFQGAIQDQLSSPASPDAAAARVLARRLPARRARRAAHLHRRDDPHRRRRSSTSSSLIPALFLVGFFFAQLGVLDRRPRRAVRRRLLRADLRPAAADLPRRRLLLGLAAARAVRDAHPLQPALLHDQPGPLRVPGLHGGEHRAVADLPHARRRPRCSPSTSACSTAATSSAPKEGQRPHIPHLNRRRTVSVLQPRCSAIDLSV